MLMRTDPFRELDRLTQGLPGSRMRPLLMAVDAYRHGDQFLVHVDVPGVDPSSIELTVEKNVLTVSAQRQWQPGDDVQVVASERPQGTFSRQLFLGESLDADHIDASYDQGVLTVKVPVVEHAKPRKVEISSGGKQRELETSAASA